MTSHQVQPVAQVQQVSSLNTLDFFCNLTLKLFQLEDIFLLIAKPQDIEKVTIQLIDSPTKAYAIGVMLFLSKVPLEVLKN